MPHGRARVQNLGHLRFFLNHLYLNNRNYLGLTLSLTSDLMVNNSVPQNGGRGQNLEHL